MQEAAAETSFDWLGRAELLLRNKFLILKCALAGGILAAIVVSLMKPVYTAEASFLPPNSLATNSTSAMLGQIGQMGQLGASALSGGGVLGALKDPSQIYIGILGSRSIADDLIRQFDLQKVYKTKKPSQTVKALAKHTKILPAKNSIVAIQVTDTDAKRAADLANAYLAALSKLNDQLALTEAGQRRAYFERQLETEKNLLADAEVDLTKTQEQTGMIVPTGQAALQMNTIAQTRAAISSREIELAAMSQGATPQNADVVRLNSEIAGLQEQLRKLESSTSKEEPGAIDVPTTKVPQLTLDYIRKEREVKYHEALYQLLLRQYEAAKLDESRSAPMLQVVDSAVVPDTKSGPWRSMITAVCVVLGGLLGVVWVTARARWERARNDPESAAKIHGLLEAAKLKP
jgi:uncharacterized protein involved in exopolysaccharide biosynthesis